MTPHVVTMAICSTVCAAAWWAHHNGLSAASPHMRYYLWVILLTSGLLTLITGLHLLIRFRSPSSSTDALDPDPSPHQRRHYRLTYETDAGPLFVQPIDDRRSGAAFTCPVRDISETGISLACTGAFRPGEIVQGEVIFASGRTATVNGTVIREDADRTCLQLHCTIAPPLLMKEQQEQIRSLKGHQRRPVVAVNASEMPSASLPSHRPKGICRLK